MYHISVFLNYIGTDIYIRSDDCWLVRSNYNTEHSLLGVAISELDPSGINLANHLQCHIMINIISRAVRLQKISR